MFTVNHMLFTPMHNVNNVWFTMNPLTSMMSANDMELEIKPTTVQKMIWTYETNRLFLYAHTLLGNHYCYIKLHVLECVRVCVCAPAVFF